MDRKFCALLYSKYSKASQDVLNYISKLPIDFPTITGMTMICIDNPEFKLILHNNGITHVPTLLVEYYDGSKQKFERDYIYMWIDQIITHNLSNNREQQNNPQSNNPTAASNAAVTFGGGQSNRTPISSIKSPPISSHSSITQSFASGSDSLSNEKGDVSDAQAGTSQVSKIPDVVPGSNKKPDIAAIALEMQKNRDLELAEIKEIQKPI